MHMVATRTWKNLKILELKDFLYWKLYLKKKKEKKKGSFLKFFPKVLVHIFLYKQPGC